MRKDLAVFVGACFVCLLVLEALLRVATPYPVPRWTGGLPRGAVEDPVLAYRMDSALADIDAAGFRGADGPWRVAAVGDSHTFGLYVAADQAWPARLAASIGEPVYNYGVPSHGVFNHHAMVERAIADGAERIVVALFLGNDFAPMGGNCMIDADHPFWRAQADLTLPHCPDKKAPPPSALGAALNTLSANSAVIGIADQHLVRPFRYVLNPILGDAIYDGGSAFIKPSYAARDAAWTDLEDPDVRARFDAFLVMARQWRARDVPIGVLLMPSLERNFYALQDRDPSIRHHPRFEADVRTQIALERALGAALDEAGLPWVDAGGFIVDALAALEDDAYGTANYYIDKTHPGPTGQEAYAAAAAALLREMTPAFAQRPRLDP